MSLLTNHSTYSRRVLVWHHNWDSGTHRYPRHDVLLPAHSWEGRRWSQRKFTLSLKFTFWSRPIKWRVERERLQKHPLFFKLGHVRHLRSLTDKKCSHQPSCWRQRLYLTLIWNIVILCIFNPETCRSATVPILPPSPRPQATTHSHSPYYIPDLIPEQYGMNRIWIAIQPHWTPMDIWK